MLRLLNRYTFFLPLVVYLLLSAGCNKKSGRVTVILDNSSSMVEVGTSFDRIKQAVVDGLMFLPYPKETGLRVFNDTGSRLVAPHQCARKILSFELSNITPQGDTFIGQSLLNAAKDLTAGPSGEKRLIFITDGKGNKQDILLAQPATNLLEQNKTDAKCYFIVFSALKNVHRQTPIGQIADIMKCRVVVPAELPSAYRLKSIFQQIVSLHFYPVRVILSLILYLILIWYSANLFFATLHACGISPKNARLGAVIFPCMLLPLVIGTHVGFLWNISPIWIWGMSFFFLAVLIGIILVDNPQQKHNVSGSDDDPFI